jgi:hypothetical protein
MLHGKVFLLQGIYNDILISHFYFPSVITFHSNQSRDSDLKIRATVKHKKINV